MLRGIPPVLSPELMKVMMEMGHGDELLLADGNFPSGSCARRLVRADGHGVPPLLEAILKFFPVDKASKHAVSLMAVDPGDPEPKIWKTYARQLKTNDSWPGQFSMLGRNEFYDRSRASYAIVATSETALYANIILHKGCVT